VGRCQPGNSSSTQQEQQGLAAAQQQQGHARGVMWACHTPACVHVYSNLPCMAPSK
jgi:hypothetical protein